MKKISKMAAGVALLLASSGAMAGQFGIGMCQYTTSPRTGELLYSIIAVSTMDDNTYKQMVDYCTKPDNMQRARVELAKQPEMPVAVPEPLPADGVNLDEATDTYQACVVGATSDGKGYAAVVGKYTRNLRMLNVLRKAHSYGYNVARTYRDCSNYVMGY